MAAPVEPAIDAVTAPIEVPGRTRAPRLRRTFRRAVEAPVDTVAAPVEPLFGAVAAVAAIARPDSVDGGVRGRRARCQPCNEP